MSSSPLLTSDRLRLLRRRLAARGQTLPAPDRVEPRPDPSDLAPLSYGQEGIWFLESVGDGTAGYGIPATLRLRGRLNVEALQRSLSLIVSRHEALRTTITSIGGRPMQRIAADLEPRLQSIDLRATGARAAETRARDLAAAEARRPFDLEHGPLLRALLLRLDAEEFVLMLNVHHIVADGWAMGILLEELVGSYRSFAAGSSPAWSPPPVQFADFVVWQRRRIEGEVGGRLIRYWRDRLHDRPSDLDLAAGNRPSVVGFRGSHLPFGLGRELTEGLERLARSLRRSPYEVLLAAFKVVLGAATGRDDIIVGSTFSNRLRAEVERVIGHFANTLPLRTDLGGDPTFAELTRRVATTVDGAHRHQELPFRVLVRELGGHRDASCHPIFQVVFDYLTPDRNPILFGYGLASEIEEDLHLPGVQISSIDIDNGVSRFDLALFLWNTPAEIAGSVEFNTDLLDRRSVAELLEAFRTVLASVQQLPSASLSELVRTIDLRAPLGSRERVGSSDRPERSAGGLRATRRQSVDDRD